MEAWAWIIVAVAVVLAIVAVWRIAAERRTARLRRDFGPEYDRTVAEEGDRREAERALRDREARRDRLDIRPLSEESRARHADEWQDVQARFVDEPAGAVGDADRLVGAVMRERGYPMDDFEAQAELVSVDHPGVVEHYRAGHAAYEAYDRGGSSTEDLRQAMVHYRALFEDLLGTGRGGGDRIQEVR
jgi:hypothetical protein